MNKLTTLTILLLLLLPLVPTAQAAWTTSASAPASFRPNRAVTFSYTAQSSSGVDLPIQWNVDLYTCIDTSANGRCEIGESQFVFHSRKPLNVFAGQSGSVSWIVNLPEPEGAYRYDFRTFCANNPCATQPAGGAHDKNGAFQLQYTNTWTRTILTTNPTSAGTTQSVTYRMTSTSVDDRDLAGIAELYSTPPGGSEDSQGAKSYSANANTIVNVQWPNVAFPTIGTHELRVTDTNSPDTDLDVIVRGVHLHVVQPREVYTAGARASLYFTLEGHGASPDPQGIIDDIELTVRNGTWIVSTTTVRTSLDGRVYANVTTAEDHDTLTWEAQTSGTWLGIAYELREEGQIRLTDPTLVAKNVSAIRDNLSEVQLKGVHLDDVGTRNAWLASVRAAGYALTAALLVLLIAAISSRM